MLFSNALINGGTFIHNSKDDSQKKVKTLLLNHIAQGAFHDSGERYDPPKCHPNTRVAVIKMIMDWVGNVQREYPIQWLNGAAGAGKSSIAQKIAELCSSLGVLLGCFFFCRTAEGRNSSQQFVPTIAYQLACSIPTTCPYIQHAIEDDPSVFNKSLEIQFLYLVVRPLQQLEASAHHADNSSVYPHLLIIDGLDECHDESRDSEAQVYILRALCKLVHQHKLPLAVLIASRPEHHLRSFFDIGTLNKLSARITLDEAFRPDEDIKRYLVDNFVDIKNDHPFRRDIPADWPSSNIIDLLVAKSSGQFIFASTVMKFVAASRGHPVQRLNIVCGLPTRIKDYPYEELDTFYHHIFSSIQNIDIVSKILALKSVSTYFSTLINFLPLEVELPVGLEYYLADLDHIVIRVTSNDEGFHFLHASLQDFLLDRFRSREFHISLEYAHAVAAVCNLKALVSCPKPSGADRYRIYANIQDHLQYASPTDELRQAILDFDMEAAVPYFLNLCWPRALAGVNPWLWMSDFLLSIRSSSFSDASALCSHVRLKAIQYIELELQKYLKNKEIHEMLILTINGTSHCLRRCSPTTSDQRIMRGRPSSWVETARDLGIKALPVVSMILGLNLYYFLIESIWHFGHLPDFFNDDERIRFTQILRFDELNNAFASLTLWYLQHAVESLKPNGTEGTRHTVTVVLLLFNYPLFLPTLLHLLKRSGPSRELLAYMQLPTTRDIHVHWSVTGFYTTEPSVADEEDEYKIVSLWCRQKGMPNEISNYLLRCREAGFL